MKSIKQKIESFVLWIDWIEKGGNKQYGQNASGVAFNFDTEINKQILIKEIKRKFILIFIAGFSFGLFLFWLLK